MRTRAKQAQRHDVDVDSEDVGVRPASPGSETEGAHAGAGIYHNRERDSQHLQAPRARFAASTADAASDA